MSTFIKTKKDGKTNGYVIQWSDKESQRRTISLSARQYSEKNARCLANAVDSLVYCQRNGTVPDKVTERWLKEAPDDFQEKLAKVGLIAMSEPVTVGMLWDAFLTRENIKSSSIKSYQTCQKNFYREFSPTELAHEITTDRLLAWKKLLLSEQKEATVAGIIQAAKAVFNFAVEKERLQKSPMKGISRGSFRNRDNDRFVTREEYAKCLEVCPTQERRVLLALARIGGLRCPSELEPLRWSDIYEDRFLVRSPKTERYEKHRERLVPLFSGLRQELERLRSLINPKDDDFVIQYYQGTTWNIISSFDTIARKAGLGKIVRPFDNMRMSRCNEVLRKHGPLKESIWMGHSFQTMQDHYLHLTDEDYIAAAEE